MYGLTCAANVCNITAAVTKLVASIITVAVPCLSKAISSNTRVTTVSESS